MHATPVGDPRESQGEEMVGSAQIHESADLGGNDRGPRVIWAAGFFDGEGSIGIYRTRRRSSYALTIAVNQVDRRPLDIYQQLFEGNIYQSRKGQYPIHAWRTSSRKAAAVLAEMLPYLVNKREQAEVAIQFQSGLVLGMRPGRHGWGNQPLSESELAVQEQAANKLKALKHLT